MYPCFSNEIRVFDCQLDIEAYLYLDPSTQNIDYRVITFVSRMFANLSMFKHQIRPKLAWILAQTDRKLELDYYFDDNIFDNIKKVLLISSKMVHPDPKESAKEE